MTRGPLVAVGDAVVLLVARYRGPDDEVPATVEAITQGHDGPYFTTSGGLTRCAWKELGWRKP